MGRANTTQAKRARELNRDEHARAKAADRAERKLAYANRPKSDEGIDPDLVGIVAGPQPIPEEDE